MYGKLVIFFVKFLSYLLLEQEYQQDRRRCCRSEAYYTKEMYPWMSEERVKECLNLKQDCFNKRMPRDCANEVFSCFNVTSYWSFY